MTTKETSRKKGIASFDVYVDGEHHSTIEMAKPMTAWRAVREAERTAEQLALGAAESVAEHPVLWGPGHTLLFVCLDNSLLAAVKAIPKQESRGKRRKVRIYTEVVDF